MGNTLGKHQPLLSACFVILLALWTLLVSRLSGPLMWTSQVTLLSPSQDISFLFSAESCSLFHIPTALQVVFLQSSWSADLRTHSWVRKKPKTNTINKTKSWSLQCSQLHQCRNWMPNKMGWNTNYGKTLQKSLSAPVRVQASKLVSRGTKVSCQIWIISLHVDKSSISTPPSTFLFPALLSFANKKRNTRSYFTG